MEVAGIMILKIVKQNKSVYILIYNEQNELLLQLRSANDESYPLHYDFSAAGGIEEGETVEQAAYRELQEELGIRTTLEFVGEDEHEGEQMYIYRGISSEGFKIGDEVESIRFASHEDIHDMIDTGELFHPEFLFFIHTKLQVS